MGALYKVVLADNAAGTTNPYVLPLDASYPGFTKRKKQTVRQIPGKSGGINTADKKLMPGTLDVTFQVDDDLASDLATLRRLLWTKLNNYEGKYIVFIDTLADPDAVVDSWLYDEVVLFGHTTVKRSQLRVARIRATLSCNTQPYEENGDIPA